MATKVFLNKEGLEKWIERVGSPTHYEVTVTSKNEIILQPTKSTRNLNTGYLVEKSKDCAEAIAERFEESGYAVDRVKEYIWNGDMMPLKEL
tara:strand:+ start:2178 stop:2453 length:276 start_codon:yes stop_codon:yes gene_type:complete